MEKRKVKAKSKEINFDLVEIKAMQESLSQVLTKLKDRIHTKEAEVWKEKGELLLKEFSTLMKDKPGMTGTQFQFHNYLRKIIKKKHGLN